jgi:hypothetical protein
MLAASICEANEFRARAARAEEVVHALLRADRRLPAEPDVRHVFALAAEGIQ